MNEQGVVLAFEESPEEMAQNAKARVCSRKYKLPCI
jgi:hypothetical protein